MQRNREDNGKDRCAKRDGLLFYRLQPVELLGVFRVPKNEEQFNNKPPAMRVRVECYTKNYLSVYYRVVQAILQKGKVIYGEERKCTCTYEMDV